MSDNKPVLLCISNEVDLQTGKTREVSRLYGNASGMVCDVQTAERNADRLAAMRETDGAKPFDLTADQFAAVSAYYAACRQPTPNAAAEDLPQPPAYLNPAVNPAHPQTGRANGNGAFVGQVVSFTGRLPHMTREQAIQAVQLNGGKAFKSMPRYTTILVVGDRPGITKLDHADEWIDHVRKITPAQFNAMLTLPIRNA
jgi:hypothetical protein